MKPMTMTRSLFLLASSALTIWAADPPAAVTAHDQAVELVTQRAQEIVQPPYTPARIDQWASQLTDEANQVLTKTGPTTRTVGGQNGLQRRPTSLWPASTTLQGATGSVPVGATLTQIRNKRITIPGQSYANGYLLIGATPEIGGRGNIPVSVQIEFQWVGPSFSRLPMTKARLGGVANAMAGPEKVAIDLDKLSLVLPSGRAIDHKCNAIVVDNKKGQYGAIGTYQWNLDKTIALAMLAGGGQGAADALKSATQTQIVTSTGPSVTVPATGDLGKQVVAGGVANSFGILTDHVKGVLKDVRPSVDATNGQRLTVFVVDPVEIDVTPEEYDALEQGENPGGFGSGAILPRLQPSVN